MPRKKSRVSLPVLKERQQRRKAHRNKWKAEVKETHKPFQLTDGKSHNILLKSLGIRQRVQWGGAVVLALNMRLSLKV